MDTKERLLSVIKHNPDLRTELISQIQMDDETSAILRFKAALTGVCLALSIPLDAATLTSITHESLAFRQFAPVAHTWAGQPSDPNPHREALEALQTNAAFMGMMEHVAAHFTNQDGDRAMPALISAYLLTLGYPRHFWVYGEVGPLSFCARHPQNVMLFANVTRAPSTQQFIIIE